MRLKTPYERASLALQRRGGDDFEAREGLHLMGIQEVYTAVKRATVAIVMEFPGRIPARPFAIIGSGFCIHPEGVVVTWSMSSAASLTRPAISA
jgi:hypothetical protein